jgi:hypothetical protein
MRPFICYWYCETLIDHFLKSYNSMTDTNKNLMMATIFTVYTLTILRKSSHSPKIFTSDHICDTYHNF